MLYWIEIFWIEKIEILKVTFVSCHKYSGWAIWALMVGLNWRPWTWTPKERMKFNFACKYLADELWIGILVTFLDLSLDFNSKLLQPKVASHTGKPKCSIYNDTIYTLQRRPIHIDASTIWDVQQGDSSHNLLDRYQNWINLISIDSLHLWNQKTKTF